MIKNLCDFVIANDANMASPLTSIDRLSTRNEKHPMISLSIWNFLYLNTLPYISHPCKSGCGGDY